MPGFDTFRTGPALMSFPVLISSFLFVVCSFVCAVKAEVPTKGCVINNGEHDGQIDCIFFGNNVLFACFTP